MEWTGIMGYTKDEQPIIGQAPGQDGLWICAGFHGHGKFGLQIAVLDMSETDFVYPL